MEEAVNNQFIHVSSISKGTENETVHYGKYLYNYPNQGQYELEAVTPEPDSEEIMQEEESSAVDLTTTTQLVSTTQEQKSSKVLYTHKKDMLSIAELLESFYFNDSYLNGNLSPMILVANSVRNVDYLVSSSNNSINKSITFAETATNTDIVPMVDKESQTNAQTTQEVAVQTDLANDPKTNTTFPFTVKNGAPVKYICSVCQRFYSSKCSYNRHIRTHTKGMNRKMTVRLTTEAKLQICKKPISIKQTTEKPIAVKAPHIATALQCNLCKEYFPNLISRDSHQSKCIVEPFPFINCNECSAKFFTRGAKNCHITVVHKKYLATNTYNCVFCNEKFDNSYNFQLHLDKHIYP